MRLDVAAILGDASRFVAAGVCPARATRSARSRVALRLSLLGTRERVALGLFSATTVALILALKRAWRVD